MSGSDGSSEDKVKKTSVWDVDLARVSVSIAVYLEVFPLEAGILNSLVYSSFPLRYSILLMLVVKIICLTLILSPLLVYVHRNGLPALSFVAGRVTIVAAIIALNLVCFVMMLLVVFRRAGVV